MSRPQWRKSYGVALLGAAWLAAIDNADAQPEWIEVSSLIAIGLLLLAVGWNGTWVTFAVIGVGYLVGASIEEAFVFERGPNADPGDSWTPLEVAVFMLPLAWGVAGLGAGLRLAKDLPPPPVAPPADER